MSDMLARIIATKHDEVASAKAGTPLAEQGRAGRTQPYQQTQHQQGDRKQEQPEAGADDVEDALQHG